MNEEAETFFQMFPEAKRIIIDDGSEDLYAFIAHLEDIASTSLTKGEKYLSDESKRLLKSSVDAIRKDVNSFLQDHIFHQNISLNLTRLKYNENYNEDVLKFIQYVGKLDSNSAHTELWRIIGHAFIIGSRGTVTKSAENYFNHQHTAKARKGASDDPARAALVVAVNNHRWRDRLNRRGEAAAILEKVNAELATMGHNPAKVDQIRYILNPKTGRVQKAKSEN